MPPNHVPQLPPGGQHHENPYYRPNERQDMFVGQISEEEFQEIMEKNKSVSSSAISRAVTDASAGMFLFYFCENK
jgi:cleavage and polyadenylation specificity factor subunit 6/7